MVNKNSMQFSLLAITLLLGMTWMNSAWATDFSDNPFLESQKQLLRARGQTSLFTIPGNTNRANLLNNYQLNVPTSGTAVDDTTSSTNLFATPFAYGAGVPLARPYLYRRGFWGGGFRPHWGGFGVNPAMLGVASGAPAFGVTPFAGGYGVPGLGWGGLGYGGLGWGGYGYRGFGWGGLYNPAGAALSMGAFGNWADNNELGEMGYTGPVNEGPPSKASGNYYAPSTPDPTAAGNYYSTSSPAVQMPIKPYTSPKNYWGSSGSPLPKDINKVPW